MIEARRRVVLPVTAPMCAACSALRLIFGFGSTPMRRDLGLVSIAFAPAGRLRRTGRGTAG